MKKILLIENNETLRDNTVELLRMYDYEVLTAKDGKEGVSMALMHKPDLIICDIMMPVLDGFGVLHILRKNTASREIPFIFITGKAERGDIRKGMDLGGDDYITKPFAGEELLSSIEMRLAKSSYAENQDQVSPCIHVKETMIHSLIAGGDIRAYQNRQVIYSDGSYSRAAYYVKKGKVKRVKYNDGKELVVGLYKEGDIFGHIAILRKTTQNETAITMDESEIIVIQRPVFEKFFLHNSQLLHPLACMLAENLAEQEQRLVHLAYNSLRKKVAKALIMLFEKYGAGDAALINTGRETLANIAGTAKESLARVLGEFRGEKLINIKNGIIILLNEQKLRNLVN